MKGKMRQAQIVCAAGGGGFLLLVGVAGYFGWGSLGEVQTQAQAVADRKVKPELAAILARPGGAGAARKEAEELKKLAGEISLGEEALVGSWREGLAEAEGTGQGWAQDPNQWKDRLIAANDVLKKQSGKKGDNSRVVLADDFYLGLQQYKQQNPPAEQVPDLARQLSVADKLVLLLLEAKKTAKEAYPTQCLLQSIVGPGSMSAEMTKGTGEKGKAGGNAVGILREGYTLQFECSPEVLYGFVQRVATDPWLFVVVDLALENDLKEFPKRSEVAKKFAGGKQLGDGGEAGEAGAGNAGGGARGSGVAPARPPLLLVLAGKERMKVAVRIDYVGWRAPAAEKRVEKGKSG